MSEDNRELVGKVIMCHVNGSKFAGVVKIFNSHTIELQKVYFWDDKAIISDEITTHLSREIISSFEVYDKIDWLHLNHYILNAEKILKELNVKR